MISIGCPIYRSISFCDFVYESLMKNTPLLKNSGVEFYFVANDATPEVKKHLIDKGYRHFVQENTRFTDEQMKARGLAYPEYITRTYRGVNRILTEATGRYAVVISSDMCFSPGWLEALIRVQDGNTLVTSQLLEPPSFRANLALGSVVCDAGYHPNGFDEALFLSTADRARRVGVRPGGQFVPMMIPIPLVQKNGAFPEGNVYNGDYWGIPGDISFTNRFIVAGTPHLTALDSIVYHFTEGEMRE